MSRSIPASVVPKLFKFAIYVNASSERLRQASRSGAPSQPIIEKKRWVKGQALLSEARALGQELPLIFAQYAPLTYWAVAREIVVDDTSTTYRFADLQPLRGYRRSSLVVQSTGSELPDDFIRSYALVQTPDFLSTASPKASSGRQKTKRPDAQPEQPAVARESISVAIANDEEDLTSASAAEAVRLDLARTIAGRTGLGLRDVRARLRAAHGNALVRNLFAQEWDTAHQPSAGDRPHTLVTGTRDVGAKKRKAAGGDTLVGGRFRLGRLLGQGGQGEAYEARDEQFPERGVIVIKFASFDTATREFTVARQFRHEHICLYFDIAFDADRNRRYLVIEHGGQSLDQYVREHGAVSKSVAFPIIAQAAGALDYAHSKHVIHHDVSPGNVLIDGQGHVRVTDFGVSVAGTMRTVVGGNRTMVAETLLGKHPFYAAPEMSTGEPVRGRADQFSLALVLCSLLEGEVFTKRYRARDFQRLSARQNAAVHRALSRKPDDRFPNCVAFAHALEGG